MNLKRLLGIIYNKIQKLSDNSILVYKPVPAPIDKIKNKYRWRMILKCKVNSKVLDLIKYSIENEEIIKAKNTSIIVDINPNNLT